MDGGLCAVGIPRSNEETKARSDEGTPVNAVPLPEQRALASGGRSNNAIYEMVSRSLESRDIQGDCLIDVGCGSGNLYPFVCTRFRRYIGIDVVAYPGFPKDATFHRENLDSPRLQISDSLADVVVAVETIEHLENPREFVRKLIQLAKPGGWILVSTPNQLSLLSLLSLVVKNRFAAFHDVHYPAHLTALLEIDLVRIAQECSLCEVEIEYTQSGRIPLTGRHYASFLSRSSPRMFSDNIMLVGRKPIASTPGKPPLVDLCSEGRALPGPEAPSSTLSTTVLDALTG